MAHQTKVKWLLLACLSLSGCVTKQDRALLTTVAAQQKVESTQMAKIMAQQELVISVTLLMVDAIEKDEQAQQRLLDDANGRALHYQNK